MRSTKDLGQNTDEKTDLSIDEETGIKIDVGVPLPLDVRTGSRYPFDKMEVNDSIFVALIEGDTGRLSINRLAQAARTYGNKQEPKQHFILRIRSENETSGVRIWRRD